MGLTDIRTDLLVNLFPNSMNSKLIEGFHSYMKGNAISERHQNNNLKVIIAFAEFIGDETIFYQIFTKEEVTKFLDKKIRSNSEDPEQRWITTWNDYLVRIKHFFRWLHNCNLDQTKDHLSSSTDWYTPEFVNIKKKRAKRLRPYGEHEIGTSKIFRLSSNMNLTRRIL